MLEEKRNEIKQKEYGGYPFYVVLTVLWSWKFNLSTILRTKCGEHTFTAILIYLSIGPGLSIPRAASVPFEMTVSPYLPNDANHTLWMVLYSALFFLVALWLCLNPGKLV